MTSDLEGVTSLQDSTAFTGHLVNGKIAVMVDANGNATQHVSVDTESNEPTQGSITVRPDQYVLGTPHYGDAVASSKYLPPILSVIPSGGLIPMQVEYDTAPDDAIVFVEPPPDSDPIILACRQLYIVSPIMPPEVQGMMGEFNDTLESREIITVEGATFSPQGQNVFRLTNTYATVSMDLQESGVVFVDGSMLLIMRLSDSARVVIATGEIQAPFFLSPIGGGSLTVISLGKASDTSLQYSHNRLRDLGKEHFFGWRDEDGFLNYGSLNDEGKFSLPIPKTLSMKVERSAPVEQDRLLGSPITCFKLVRNDSSSGGDPDQMCVFLKLQVETQFRAAGDIDVQYTSPGTFRVRYTNDDIERESFIVVQQAASSLCNAGVATEAWCMGNYILPMTQTYRVSEDGYAFWKKGFYITINSAGDFSLSTEILDVSLESLGVTSYELQDTAQTKITSDRVVSLLDTADETLVGKGGMDEFSEADKAYASTYTYIRKSEGVKKVFLLDTLLGEFLETFHIRSNEVKTVVSNTLEVVGSIRVYEANLREIILDASSKLDAIRETLDMLKLDAFVNECIDSFTLVVSILKHLDDKSTDQRDMIKGFLSDVTSRLPTNSLASNWFEDSIYEFKHFHPEIVSTSPEMIAALENASEALQKAGRLFESCINTARMMGETLVSSYPAFFDTLKYGSSQKSRGIPVPHSSILQFRPLNGRVIGVVTDESDCFTTNNGTLLVFNTNRRSRSIRFDLVIQESLDGGLQYGINVLGGLKRTSDVLPVYWDLSRIDLLCASISGDCVVSLAPNSPVDIFDNGVLYEFVVLSDTDSGWSCILKEGEETIHTCGIPGDVQSTSLDMTVVFGDMVQDEAPETFVRSSMGLEHFTRNQGSLVAHQNNVSVTFDTQAFDGTYRSKDEIKALTDAGFNVPSYLRNEFRIIGRGNFSGGPFSIGTLTVFGYKTIQYEAGTTSVKIPDIPSGTVLSRTLVVPDDQTINVGLFPLAYGQVTYNVFEDTGTGSTVAELKNRVEQLTLENTTLNDELEEVNNELLNIKGTLEDVNNDLDAANHSLELTKKDLEDVRNALNEADTKFDEAAEKHQEDIKRLNADITKRDEDLKDVKNALNEAGVKFDEAAEKHVGDIKRLNTELSEREEDLKRSEQKVEELIAATSIKETSGLSMAEAETFINRLFEDPGAFVLTSKSSAKWSVSLGPEGRFNRISVESTGKMAVRTPYDEWLISVE
jgi:uncharacterized protein YukE